MNTQPTTNPTFTPAEIAAAQAANAPNSSWAYERNAATEEKSRLQVLYARRRAQLGLLAALFEEGTPELTLQGETQQLTLRGELVADTYAVLRDALDKTLIQLEKAIIQAHLAIAQQERHVAGYQAKGEADYLPAILALCEPTAPLTVRLAPEQPTAHALAA